jgi:ABC-type multidrug transport system ATPase subunit
MNSIHQPDMRLLSLFDHILLLGDGGSLFFGTLSEALQHFAALGYPVPHNTNPADHFLAVTDTAFSSTRQQHGSSDVCSNDCNFRQECATSAQAQQVHFLETGSVELTL